MNLSALTSSIPSTVRVPFGGRCALKARELEAVASHLTAKHSAFDTVEELLTAKGSYRPSMDMRQPEIAWLADYYDAAQEARGDERRAYRYGQPAPAPEAPKAMPVTKRTLRGPGGILLALDPTDQDTPAMVWSAFRRHSASYWCALDNGLAGSRADLDMDLTQAMAEWLVAQEDAVAAIEAAARPAGWAN